MPTASRMWIWARSRRSSKSSTTCAASTPSPSRMRRSSPTRPSTACSRRSRDQPYQDRYTRFMEPTDYRGFLDENEGHFGGIGAEIGMREVDASGAPMPPRTPRTPRRTRRTSLAALLRGGVHAGCQVPVRDRLAPAGQPGREGRAAPGRPHPQDRRRPHRHCLGEAVKQIKGRPGTTVALLISRDGTDPKEVQVTRSTISVKSVDWKMLADNIGYMHIGASTTPPRR